MKYLMKNYGLPACLFVVLCVVVLAVIGSALIDVRSCSFGILVLILLALMLCVLSIIAVVAFYRESGRYFERYYPEIYKKEVETETNKKQIENSKKSDDQNSQENAKS